MRGSLYRIAVAFFTLFAATVDASDSNKEKELDFLKSGKVTAGGIREFKEIKRLGDLPSWPTSLAFSIDDKLLAIGLKDQIQLVDVESKSVSKTIATNSGQVRSIAFRTMAN